MRTSHYVDDPVFLRSGFTCTYCGCDLLADFPTFMLMARDHLVPKSAGGPDAAENRVASCGVCDRAKGHVVPVDLFSARMYVERQRAWLVELYEAVKADVRG
jgi:5-methylcytosine-specific restriction endonuclease McrA